MNKKFKAAVIDILTGYDESSLAEIFNVFATNPENIDYWDKPEQMVFNIMDNWQAARAVRRFGLQAVAEASQDDWVVFAQKGADGKWQFSSKAPSEAVMENVEKIIWDIIAAPHNYPKWVWEAFALPVTQLAAGLFDTVVNPKSN